MTQFNMLNAPQGPDPKRLLLAVIATSAVLMVYSYFFQEVPQPKEVAVVQEEPKKLETPAVQKLVHDTFAHEAATPFDIPRSENTFDVVDKTDDLRTSYQAVMSNYGGLIDAYSLLDFSKPYVLFDQEKFGSSLLKLSLKSETAPLKSDIPYEMTGMDPSFIKFKHITKDGLEIERHYQFEKRAVIKEKIQFKNLSAAPIKVQAELLANKRDENLDEPSFFNPGVQGQSIAIRADGKYQRLLYSDLLDKPKSFGAIKYVAFDDQFFLSAIIPEYGNEIETTELLVKGDSKQKLAKIELKLKPFILLQGEEKSFSHELFLGPKQVNLLSSLPIPLDENIDFGWFGVLSRPMLWLLVEIYGFVLNYGLAIIIITFIIKLLTYPLTHKSFTSQQEMKKLQPKLKEIQQKFSHDRTLLGQKQMELYKSHGINPVAGCLPLLIQLPIWFAFFQMLRNSVELFDQPFYLWIVDLTKPDPYFVLPVLMGISMLIQQAFTPPPAEQPHMKYVMWAMPVFLTFIMLNMPSGLSLYILTNNLLTIVQQIIIKKRLEKINA